jgi:hypothetical protein
MSGSPAEEPPIAEIGDEWFAFKDEHSSNR